MGKKIFFVFLVLFLMLCIGSEATERTGDISSFIFKVDYSTHRSTLNGSNSLLTYNTRTGTMPQVITGDSAILDITPTNKPPMVINLNNLFNFKELTTEVVWAALSLVLNNTQGTIDFEETIDISNREVVDLDSYVSISANYIFINDTALSELNKSAVVTIRNLTFSNVRVLKNGEDCLGCTIISYSSGDVQFRVPGFAIYQAADGSVSPAIRISTNVIVTNTSMNLTPDTYNGSYPSNVTIDVGNDGIIEFSQQGEFNSSSSFTNFTDALNSILPGCACNGCTLSNNNLTCTVMLNISSDSAGTVELSELNVSQVIDNASWEEDHSFSLLDLDDYFYDPDRDVLSYSYSEVENISISVVNGLVTLTPDPNFYGNRTIFFNASDGTNTTLSNNVTVNIINVPEVYRDTYDGRTTNFTVFNRTELQNITNIILENQRYGMINFSQVINISGDTNLDLHVNISYNRIFLNSTNLSNFNKSATLYLYNLTFDDPRILRDGSACPASICTELSYNGRNLTFNVTQFTVYSTDESPIFVPSPGPTSVGGEAGVAVKKLVPIKNFSLSPERLKLKLVTDEIRREELVITNIGNVKLEFTIEVEAEFVFIDEKEFELEAGSSKSVAIDIIAGPGYGIYTGEIIVKADGIEKKIPVILEISTKKVLFDVMIDIPLEYKEVYPGEDIRAQVTLFNILKEEADVSINYFIKDLMGDVLYMENESLTIEDQLSYAKEFKTGEDWAAGDYLVVIEAMYGNSYSVASEMFSIKELVRPSPPEAVRYQLISLLLIVVSIVIIVLIVTLIEKRAKKKKKKK